MRTIKAIILGVACLTAGAANAQWVVHDPGNLAQGIVNSVNEMVETSETAQNAMSTFKEASKIYEQSRKYYDMLKSVNSLVSGSLKVKESVLMLSEISESYVTNYGKMLTDGNYTQRELEAIAFGYNNIMKKSSASVAGLKDIINPTGMSMTDKERLDIINRIYGEVLEYKNLTWYYTRKNIGISYLRSKKKGDSRRVLALYGTHDQRYW